MMGSIYKGEMLGWATLVVRRCKAGMEYIRSREFGSS
jgi:hypothetical protein